MRLTWLVVGSTLLTIFATSATATAGSGEELLALDLTPAGGGIYFLGCTTGQKDPTHCGRLSLWEQTNPIVGLQTSKAQGNRDYDPDNNMLS